MNKVIGIAALAALAGSASAQIAISEILGSTGGSDWEFVEIVNLGNAPVDITGYSVEFWDSDIAAIPGLDGASPYFVAGNVTLNPGDVYVWANGNAINGTGAGGYNGSTYNGVPFSFDAPLPSNAIENSAYTAILADNGGVAVDSWYFSDGGEGDGDIPNRNGTPIAPNFSVPLDGSFLAPGAYRVGNALGGLLYFNTPTFGPPELNDGTLAGGTPGYNQVPAPGALALLGLGGLAAGRRRRA